MVLSICPMGMIEGVDVNINFNLKIMKAELYVVGYCVIYIAS